ncbi:MAG: hypothetical protein GY850_26425 [bacterium]|nr:hypothetical protein [bacterium]
MDKNNLYLEESLTDLKSGTIKRLVPVTEDGTPDTGRAPVFMGQTQVMTPSGALPVQCALEANNLKEAIAVFPEAIKQTIEKMIEEAQKMRREQSSRIVAPGQGGGNKIIT